MDGQAGVEGWRVDRQKVRLGDKYGLGKEDGVECRQVDGQGDIREGEGWNEY